MTGCHNLERATSSICISWSIYFRSIGDVDLDVLDPVTGCIDEFGKVDRTVGGGSVVYENGRAVIAVGVEMREIHLGIRRAGLGGKNQPMSVGREAMPGVHQPSVGAHPARDSSTEWNNVELAVRTHELPVVALHKDDPTSVGRDLGKVIAHAVLRCPDDRLRRAALSAIEGDPVKVVLNGSLVGVIRV